MFRRLNGAMHPAVERHGLVQKTLGWDQVGDIGKVRVRLCCLRVRIDKQSFDLVGSHSKHWHGLKASTSVGLVLDRSYDSQPTREEQH